MAKPKKRAAGAKRVQSAGDDIERRVTSLVGELRTVSDQLLGEIAERREAEHALRQSQETVTALLNAPPDSALLIDAEGTILAANELAIKRLRRYAPDHPRLVGANVYDLFPGELTEKRRTRNEKVIATGQPARFEDEKNGRWYDNSTYPVLEDDGSVTALAIFTRDITLAKQAEHAVHAVQQSQQTIKALLNAPTDAALLVDVSGKIMAANETAARRLASHARIAFKGDPEKLHGMNVYELLPKDLAATRRQRNEEVVESGEPARFEDERNGAWFDNSIYPVLDVDGKTVALAIFTRDITELKRAQERFKHLAFHDSLTGLPNRAALQARLDVALTEAQRVEGSLTVMSIDLDGFKQLNDTMGHAAGDQLLTVVATRLGKVIRGDDMAARLGGDEFVLMFPGTGAENAPMLAGRVVRAIGLPCDVMGEQVTVSTSVGVAVYPEDGLDSTALMRSADAAMYRAKGAGRNQYALTNGDGGEVRVSGNRRTKPENGRPKLRVVKNPRREDLAPVTA
jgi:diguanylate cyclase (GGDEF)-like protein/PAS domain S-box-containing protein